MNRDDDDILDHGQLTDTAADLLSAEGRLNALAELYTRLASGELTRDQTSALIGARRCLAGFMEAHAAIIAQREHKQLTADLAETRRIVVEGNNKRMGSNTSFGEHELDSIPRADDYAGTGAPSYPLGKAWEQNSMEGEDT